MVTPPGGSGFAVVCLLPPSSTSGQTSIGQADTIFKSHRAKARLHEHTFAPGRSGEKNGTKLTFGRLGAPVSFPEPVGTQSGTINVYRRTVLGHSSVDLSVSRKWPLEELHTMVVTACPLIAYRAAPKSLVIPSRLNLI